MKAHIGVDADSGLVHTVRGTAGSVHDVLEANTLLHGDETEAWGYACYQGAEPRTLLDPSRYCDGNWRCSCGLRGAHVLTIATH